MKIALGSLSNKTIALHTQVIKESLLFNVEKIARVWHLWDTPPQSAILKYIEVIRESEVFYWKKEIFDSVWDEEDGARFVTPEIFVDVFKPQLLITESNFHIYEERPAVLKKLSDKVQIPNHMFGVLVFLGKKEKEGDQICHSYLYSENSIEIDEGRIVDIENSLLWAPGLNSIKEEITPRMG
jgi:hypothetical protein